VKLTGRQTTTNWGVVVPKVLDDTLEKAVKAGTFKTKSDFIRDCVRRKLESMGFAFTISKRYLKEKPQNE